MSNKADRLDDDAFQALPDTAYVPQGGGPPEGHRCGGEPLTQLLMPAFLAWFTKHYDWHYPSEDASTTGNGLAPLRAAASRAPWRRESAGTGPTPAPTDSTQSP